MLSKRTFLDFKENSFLGPNQLFKLHFKTVHYMYHLELNLKVTFLDFTGISYYVQTGVKGHFGPKFNTFEFFFKICYVFLKFYLMTAVKM